MKTQPISRISPPDLNQLMSLLDVEVVARVPQSFGVSGTATIDQVVRNAGYASRGSTVDLWTHFVDPLHTDQAQNSSTVEEAKAHAIQPAHFNRPAPPIRSKAMSYIYKIIDSPVGKLKLAANRNRLAAILWERDREGRVRLGPMFEDKQSAVLNETEKQLKEYFAGKRTRFDLQLDFAGTQFQKKVWDALLSIPFGETRSYAQIAEQIGNVKAVRAVGAANGRNPISIIAPCHRVIGSSGDLTGFAGGLKTKELLLSLEGSKPEVTAQRRLKQSKSVGGSKQTALFANL